ncbi:trypsin-like serine peptidase [Streptomyces sp. NPDC048232]|uniref:trypsin-like serine peptidase n=1 Tax=Streptomyces sp. NPDC048232 TaxID=3365520 RepID=UPI00370F8B13
MDYRQLFSEDATKQEFLDRFDEIAANAAEWDGPESTTRGLTVDRAAEAVARMNEGRWAPGDSRLEAIIRRFTRPVYLIQRSTIVVPAEGMASSDEVAANLDGARSRIEPVIPSVGRIDLRNHHLDWVGTGWLVTSRLVVTNRHVADQFARPGAGGFAFRKLAGRQVRAVVDWYHEYEQPDESRFPVEEVVWIEPDESPFDLALLRIRETSEDSESPPLPIELHEPGLTGLDVGRWIAVIGYPAQDSRAHALDQQRIFDGVYNCKRLAAGRVTAVEGRGILSHDATTLGGNSGSVVVDLDGGRAVGLHFGGLAGSHNAAVDASLLARLVHTYDS